MLPPNNPVHICIAIDDNRLLANAGLIIPVTLALHLGLSRLLRKDLDLGDAPGWANTGARSLRWSPPHWRTVTESTTPFLWRQWPNFSAPLTSLIVAGFTNTLMCRKTFIAA